MTIDRFDFRLSKSEAVDYRMSKKNNMNKIIVITGSTDGIGKLAAIRLAKDGHQVYLHGRNATKLAKVIEKVKLASNNENISGFTDWLRSRVAVFDRVLSRASRTRL